MSIQCCKCGTIDGDPNDAVFDVLWTCDKCLRKDLRMKLDEANRRVTMYAQKMVIVQRSFPAAIELFQELELLGPDDIQKLFDEADK